MAKGILGFIILIMMSVALGSEKPEGGEGEHGAPSKEGDEASKGAGAYIKKDEYLELNAAVEQTNAKIKAKRESLVKMLQDKDHIKDPKEFRNTVKQIEKEYQEIKKLTETLEQKKAVIRFRFPDKGFVKQKNKIKLESLEEIGQEASVDKELDAAVQTMRSQYGRIVNPEKFKKREPARDAHVDEVVVPLPNKDLHPEKKSSEPLLQEVPTPDNDPTGTVILRK